MNTSLILLILGLASYSNIITIAFAKSNQFFNKGSIFFGSEFLCRWNEAGTDRNMHNIYCPKYEVGIHLGLKNEMTVSITYNEMISEKNSTEDLGPRSDIYYLNAKQVLITSLNVGYSIHLLRQRFFYEPTLGLFFGRFSRRITNDYFSYDEEENRQLPEDTSIKINSAIYGLRLANYVKFSLLRQNPVYIFDLMWNLPLFLAAYSNQEANGDILLIETPVFLLNLGYKI